MTEISRKKWGREGGEGGRSSGREEIQIHSNEKALLLPMVANKLPSQLASSMPWVFPSLSHSVYHIITYTPSTGLSYNWIFVLLQHLSLTLLHLNLTSGNHKSPLFSISFLFFQEFTYKWDHAVFLFLIDFTPWTFVRLHQYYYLLMSLIVTTY